MISLNDIRIAIAAKPDIIRSLLLTEQQSRIFQFVRKQKQPIRSGLIAKRFGLSPQHTCMVMGKLHGKGYVHRISQPQDTGGYEYEYISQID